METITNVDKAQWENELQALKNAIISLKMEGYEVWANHNGFRSKTTFLLRDETGNSITGSWNYDRLNHFIMGYGKAKSKCVNTHDELIEALNRVDSLLVNLLAEGRPFEGIRSKVLTALKNAQ